MSAPIAGATLLADEQGSYPALTGMVPAETSRRVIGRVIESVFALVCYFVPVIMIYGWFMQVVSSYSYDYYAEPDMTGLWVGLVASVILPVALVAVQVYCWVRKGNHVGGAILGLVNVEVATGLKSGSRTAGKNLLVNALGSLTFAIVPVIMCFATIKGTTRRNAFDRLLGVMVVDTKRGAGPRAAGLTSAVVDTPVQHQRRAIEAVSLGSGGGVVGQPPAKGHSQPAVMPISYPQPGSAQPAMGVPVGLPPETPRWPAPIAQPPTPAMPAPPKLPTYSDPFADSGAAPVPDSIRNVAQPGADAFIEVTPFSGARPPIPEPGVSAPINKSPIVVREMASVAADAVSEPAVGDQGTDQTVVDAEAFTPAPVTPPAKVTGLLLDDQTELSTTEVTLLGRNPIADAISDLGPAVSVPVADPDMAISKTHLAVGVEDGQWWVMDLRSTNGTQLVAADGTVTKIEPGAKTVVPAGVSVRFGSHLIKVKP